LITAPHAHLAPTVIDVPDWCLPSIPEAPVGSPAFVQAAACAARTMPPTLHDELVAFADSAPAAGAVVFRGLTVGALPHTPSSPTEATTKHHTSEFVLLAAARRLGQPVGYEPEHGGDLVQNLVPTKHQADRQVSTSSNVTLMFHTEAAFHPHRPRYLLLFCLRGDANAVTTLASIDELLPRLPPDVVGTLWEPRFRTAVDESYLHGRTNVLGAPAPVLFGNRHRPSMVFDADLMVGADHEAEHALTTLSAAIDAHHTGLVLQAGDLLVVDNDRAVHGRSPYRPRWDGYDRWVQRSMAVADLAPSAADRNGRVIVTRFGV